MPDATLHLSRLRRALDLDTPTLCRYDVNVTYEGDQSTGHHKELSPTMVFARLLVPEEPAQVDQCSYSQFVTASAEIARFFTTPPAPTQFAIYIGFKSPHQEGTLLECKFCLPQFVQGGWTWDIVGSESLQDAFRVSFTIHFFMNDRRIEISHDTKIRTTSLRIFTSCESLDIEERLLQKLVDSPASKARAYALFVHGRRLFLHSRHANDVQYLDLSIHALSASCAQDRTQSHLAQFDELLCHILFVRCTLPEGDPHVDKAFDALKRFDITPDPGFGESTIYTIFQVLEKHPHPDYITLTFRILAPSICALSRKPPTDPRSLVKVGLLAVHLAPGMKETYTITESALPIMGSLLPHHNFEVFLISRAVSCIHSHIDGVDIGHDVIIAAIDSVRDHHQKHEGVVFNRDLLRTFVSAAIHYLQNSAGTIIMILAGPLHLKRVLSFLDWIISLGPDSEIVPEFYSQSYPHFLPILRRSTVVAVWIHFITVLDVRNKHYEWKGLCMKQLIQLVYRYIECHSIGDDLLAVIEEQMMYPEHGKVVPSSECGLSEEIDDFLEYSLSTKPQDHIALIRVIIATTIARSFGHPIAMKGYQLVMSESSVEMFDYQWMTPIIRKIALFRDMVTPSDAISYVLALGHDELALEWIYRSYGLVWRRIMDFQPPFTQVAAVDSKLADELTEVGTKLLGMMEDDDEIYAYAIHWQNAMREVRKLPGLDRFLQPQTLVEIQSAVDALGGPVVHLTVNRFACTALCVVPDLGEVVHIPLPQLRLRDAEQMIRWFQNSINGKGTEEIHLGAGYDGSRVGKLVKGYTMRKESVPYVSFSTILGYLWRIIVKPVLDGLAIPRSESTSVEKLPRLWWCPSGTLDGLPLHAAGIYNGDNEDSVMNYVVSSYIPTPSLISHITRAEATTPNPRFLAVANPSGCGLPGTEWELEIIRKHVAEAGPLTELVGVRATPDAVKQNLQAATWVHFACHGVQVNRQAIGFQADTIRSSLDSSLILADHARLPVLAISKLKLPQAQFAFLSACETAQEDTLSFGESPHLAAAMLVAGFRSVVGTMWRISDYYAPYVADHFYQKMFGAQGKVPDYKLSAYALHDAVKKLRDEHPDKPDFHKWVPFCHFGA